MQLEMAKKYDVSLFNKEKNKWSDEIKRKNKMLRDVLLYEKKWIPGC